MKRSIQMGLMATALSFAQVSFADFTFYSSDPNVCASLAGQWKGTGSAYNWMVGTCVYNGVGLIGPIDKAGNFIIDASADKESGSFLCPNHSTRQLNATCINGVVTVKTEYGDISGSVTANTGNASGTLTISPGITADVSANFTRMG